MNALLTTIAHDLSRTDGYIRSDNTMSFVCGTGFEELVGRLAASLRAAGLAIVGERRLDAMLGELGARPGDRMHLFEVCDPAFGARLLRLDPTLAHLLPYRVAVHEGEDTVTVTVPRPTATLAEFSHSPIVARMARGFEAALQDALRALG